MPTLVLLDHLFHGGRGIAFTSADAPHWNHAKKAVHRGMKQYGTGMERIENMVIDVVHDCMVRFEEHGGEPVDVQTDLQHFTFSSICVMAFGRDLALDGAMPGYLKYN